MTLKKIDRPSTGFAQPSTQDVALRLRAIRQSKGWSLAQVEERSGGKIKAVVLGSYERSDRALSVRRAIELATLYGTPLSYLLCAPEGAACASKADERIVIDLRSARALPTSAKNVAIFNTFLTWIATARSDWNGEVLSLRKGDLSMLALLTFTTEAELLRWLKEQQTLLTAPNPT